ARCKLRQDSEEGTVLAKFAAAQNPKRIREDVEEGDGIRSPQTSLADFCKLNTRAKTGPSRSVRLPVTPTKQTDRFRKVSPSTPTRKPGAADGSRAPAHGMRLSAACLEHTPEAEERVKDKKKKKKRKSKHIKPRALHEKEAPDEVPGKKQRLNDAGTSTRSPAKEEPRRAETGSKCVLPTASPANPRNDETDPERMHPKLCSIKFHASACGRQAPVPNEDSIVLPVKTEDGPPLTSFSSGKACNLQPRLKLPRAGSLLELPHVRRQNTSESVELSILDLRRLRPIAQVAGPIPDQMCETLQCQVEAKFIVAYREPDEGSKNSGDVPTPKIIAV
ncbi:unnamed protein product, partial [Symbiodinium microadriaticum]